MRLLTLLLWGLLQVASPAAPLPTLRIAAGDHDRSHVILSIDLPPGIPAVKALRGPDGELLPAQQGLDGRLTFIEPRLPRQTSRDYTLLSNPEFNPAPHVATVSLHDDQLVFTDIPPPPLTFQMQPSALPDPSIDPIYRRGAYLHPILTPAGTRVSDDYPANHLHHHGIWFAWTKTEFQERHPDFWNMGQKRGTVEFDQLLDRWNGPVHAGFRSRHIHRDLTSPDHPVALSETWEVRHFQNPATRDRYHVFEIVTRQECATDNALILPEYHYGGLGFRGHGDWDGAANCDFLTSEGEQDRVKGHATRGRWCYIGGRVNGKQAGLVILCHPDNFRAPQPMRIHPTEPFFCFAPQQLGEMRIEPGKPYVSRYRCYAVDGPPNRDLFESFYQDYAHPPVATLHP